jgi:hypothetical protein
VAAVADLPAEFLKGHQVAVTGLIAQPLLLPLVLQIQAVVVVVQVLIQVVLVLLVVQVTQQLLIGVNYGTTLRISKR